MAQTKEGTKKHLQTIHSKYGTDYWAKIGSKGGKVSHPETRYFTIKANKAKQNNDKLNQE